MLWNQLGWTLRFCYLDENLIMHPCWTAEHVKNRSANGRWIIVSSTGHSDVRGICLVVIRIMERGSFFDAGSNRVDVGSPSS